MLVIIAFAGIASAATAAADTAPQPDVLYVAAITVAILLCTIALIVVLSLAYRYQQQRVSKKQQQERELELMCRLINKKCICGHCLRNEIDSQKRNRQHTTNSAVNPYAPSFSATPTCGAWMQVSLEIVEYIVKNRFLSENISGKSGKLAQDGEEDNDVDDDDDDDMQQQETK